MDRDFNFIRVNEAYAHSAGHPVEFFIGKNHFELYPHPENQAIFQQVVQTGTAFTVMEKPFENPEFPEQGVTFWDWSLQPIKGSDGQTEGVVLSMVDVTERKRAQLQLSQQNQQLRELTIAEHRQRVLAEGLVQATISLNTTLELDKVLNLILEYIRRVIPYQGGDIVLLDGNIMQVSEYLGFEDYPQSIQTMEITHLVEDYPPIQQICTTLQPV